MNPKVDFYFTKEKKWQQEIEQLRKIALDCGLVEELKWGSPCYTLHNSNIILIHTFKAYCGLLFFKGALLKDTSNILIQQTENVQAARQIRFTSPQQVTALTDILKAYISQAVEIEKSGLKVELKKSTELIYSIEFQNKLDCNPELKTAFLALTPGRQRAYNLYFTAPKQSKTREVRIEKNMQQILDGKGLLD